MLYTWNLYNVVNPLYFSKDSMVSDGNSIKMQIEGNL